MAEKNELGSWKLYTFFAAMWTVFVEFMIGQAIWEQAFPSRSWTLLRFTCVFLLASAAFGIAFHWYAVRRLLRKTRSRFAPEGSDSGSNETAETLMTWIAQVHLGGCIALWMLAIAFRKVIGQ